MLWPCQGPAESEQHGIPNEPSGRVLPQVLSDAARTARVAATDKRLRRLPTAFDGPYGIDGAGHCQARHRSHSGVPRVTQAGTLEQADMHATDRDAPANCQGPYSAGVGRYELPG